jgi:hypothetical protein
MPELVQDVEERLGHRQKAKARKAKARGRKPGRRRRTHGQRAETERNWFFFALPSFKKTSNRFMSGAWFRCRGRDCARAKRNSAAELPEPCAAGGAARRGSALAHDARGEGGADALYLECQAADHRRPGAIRSCPCTEVVPGRDRADGAAERRSRGPCGGGIHQRDSALGEGEHAPRHPRHLS